jgi:hypothetical protein
MVTNLPIISDSLTLYLSEIRTFKLLTEDEERDYAVKFFEEKDLEAAHTLITSRLIKFARRSTSLERQLLRNEYAYLRLAGAFHSNVHGVEDVKLIDGKALFIPRFDRCRAESEFFALDLNHLHLLPALLNMVCERTMKNSAG